MLQVSEFVTACISRNYSFFTGVPCSFLKPLINYVIQCKDTNYMAATSEGEAVGIASGAYLAGRGALVICQNSGLGNMINPLTSLNFPYRIPIILIVTLRGEPHLKDEPQHELMGQITGDLLDTLRIRWTYFPKEQERLGEVLDMAQHEMDLSGLPFALIMKKGSFNEWDSKTHFSLPPCRDSLPPEGEFSCLPEERMARRESIRVIKERISGKDALIGTTGKIGRELFSLGDCDNQFYMVGSMGCAAAIGFAIQHILPDQRVVILDGDGAVLMKMGTLASIGFYKPEKLIHVILDNEAYESTGGQESMSPTVDFCKVAAGCGYLQSYRVDTKMDLINSFEKALKSPGPQLIHVKVSCGSSKNLGRPTIKPFHVKERFMRFLAETDKKQ